MKRWAIDSIAAIHERWRGVVEDVILSRPDATEREREAFAGYLKADAAAWAEAMEKL